MTQPDENTQKEFSDELETTGHTHFSEDALSEESEAEFVPDVIEDDEDILLDYPEDTTELELLHLKIKSLAALGLKRVPNVKSACFRQNIITDLEGIEDLPRDLEDLDLYDNRINHMNRLDHFTSVKSLDLSFNKIKHIKNISHLTSLSKLYLCQNKISHIDGIASLTNITYLELGANRIRKIENLEPLVNLEQLWLGKNKITKLEVSERSFEGFQVRSVFIKFLIKNLSSLKKLRVLSIQSNRITKLEGLEELVNLEELYISHNGIEKIEGLDNNKNLKVLDLTSNRISELENLSHLQLLEEFWASGNKLHDFNQVSKELGQLPNLSTVYFEHNPLQTDNPVTYRNKVKLSLGPSLIQIDATYIK